MSACWPTRSRGRRRIAAALHARPPTSHAAARAGVARRFTRSGDATAGRPLATSPARHVAPLTARLANAPAVRARRVVRILFANHTSAWSGAEVALMRLVDELRARPRGAVACPRRAARWPMRWTRRGSSGWRSRRWTSSMRLHPVADAGGLGSWAPAGWRWPARRRRFRADVIHANTLRVGLMAAVAVRPGRRRSWCTPTTACVLTQLGRTIRCGRARAAQRGGGRLRLHGAHVQRGPGRARSRRASTTASTTIASTPRSSGPRSARTSGIARRRAPARTGGPDHAVEGPGHLDPRPGRAARAGLDAHLLLVGRRRLHRQGRPLRQPRLPRRAGASRRRARRCATQSTSSASATTCPRSCGRST